MPQEKLFYHYCTTISLLYSYHYCEYEEYEKLRESAVHDRPKPAKAQKTHSIKNQLMFFFCQYHKPPSVTLLITDHQL